MRDQETSSKKSSAQSMLFIQILMDVTMLGVYEKNEFSSVEKHFLNALSSSLDITFLMQRTRLKKKIFLQMRCLEQKSEG